MSALSDLLPYLPLPLVAPAVGAAAAMAGPTRRLLGTPRARSAVQHFAAGLVFSAVAGELIPDLIRAKRAVALIAGFAVGVAAMLALAQLTRRLEKSPSAAGSDSPVGLLAAIGIDVAIDGLLIGVAFAAGAREGKLLVVAVTTEVLALGLAVATDLRDCGRTPRSVLAGGAMPGPVLAITAVLGASLLGGLPAWALTAVIAFGAAALLYLVTEELLVEAHETADAPWITGCFFAGFLVLLIFQTQ